MTSLNETDKPKITKNVFYRSEKNGFLLTSKKTDSTPAKMFFLSKNEATVWKSCDGKKTIKEIIEILARNNPKAQKEKICLTIKEFILELKKNGLIEIV